MSTCGKADFRPKHSSLAAPARKARYMGAVDGREAEEGVGGCGNLFRLCQIGRDTESLERKVAMK